MATVPPTTSFAAAQSRDPTAAAISLVEREGDVPDDIIESLVAEVNSSGEEEGEVGEEGELVDDEGGVCLCLLSI